MKGMDWRGWAWGTNTKTRLLYALDVIVSFFCSCALVRFVC